MTLHALERLFDSYNGDFQVLIGVHGMRKKKSIKDRTASAAAAAEKSQLVLSPESVHPGVGQEIVALGGLRMEANYKGFCHEDANIREEHFLALEKRY